MAAMSLAEAQAQLLTVNSAIEKLLTGKSVTRLEVGSGDFRRVYEYSELSLESLIALRNDLTQIIAALQVETPVFRTNTTIPLIVKKGPY